MAGAQVITNTTGDKAILAKEVIALYIRPIERAYELHINTIDRVMDIIFETDPELAVIQKQMKIVIDAIEKALAK